MIFKINSIILLVEFSYWIKFNYKNNQLKQSLSKLSHNKHDFILNLSLINFLIKFPHWFQVN
jgi:hypothetical protein